MYALKSLQHFKANLYGVHVLPFTKCLFLLWKEILDGRHHRRSI